MHDTRLLPFLAAHQDSDLRTLTGAVVAAARAEGLWQTPPGPGDRWPCTVGYEVQLYGISADGGTPSEAARNWRKRALDMLVAQYPHLTGKAAA